MANIIKAGSTVAGFTVTPDQTGVLELRTGPLAGGATALTIDASQNATFAGNLNVLGAVTGGVSGIRQVLQTSTTTSLSITTITTAGVTTGLTGTITPSSATSKILVIANFGAVSVNQGTYAQLGTFSLYKDATQINANWFIAPGTLATNTSAIGATSGVYLDSPNTTSAITYTVYARTGGASAPLTVQYGNYPSYLTLLEFKP
jgi:hypothetical protein